MPFCAEEGGAVDVEGIVTGGPTAVAYAVGWTS